jgi:hypothetical protein
MFLSFSLALPLELSLAVIKKFKPSQLSMPPRGPGLAQNDNPPEVQFCMEFYRSIHCLSKGNVLPSPEYDKKGYKGGGAVDILIPGYGFGVELLADGAGIKQHYQRFLPGGPYNRWIKSGHLMDWIVLDFRSRGVTAPHSGKANHTSPASLGLSLIIIALSRHAKPIPRLLRTELSICQDPGRFTECDNRWSCTEFQHGNPYGGTTDCLRRW